MSYLRGRTVRIIVSEPFELCHENLFGEIIYDRGNKQIMIKLTKAIQGRKLTSDLLKLEPRFREETFKPLTQNYSVTVTGALIEENTEEFDYILIGSVTID